ncbi:hypothetical protein GCM10009824_13250 [Kocuria atrinae]|uniref:Uncharacterized protein n=1 Tax=Kocuria atrinae TaxID=592377 RepID=A0ABN2XRT9_9MICC
MRLTFQIESFGLDFSRSMVNNLRDTDPAFFPERQGLDTHSDLAKTGWSGFTHGHRLRRAA